MGMNIIEAILVWQGFGVLISLMILFNNEGKFRRWHVGFFILHPMLPIFLALVALLVATGELVEKLIKSTRIGRWLAEEVGDKHD